MNETPQTYHIRVEHVEEGNLHPKEPRVEGREGPHVVSSDGLIGGHEETTRNHLQTKDVVEITYKDSIF